MSIVHVACKLPTGLNLDGQIIRGTAQGDGRLKPPETYGGYVITSNVPEEVWKKWHQANKESVMVRRNLIMADSNLAALKQRAKAHSSTSGNRPLQQPR